MALKMHKIITAKVLPGQSGGGYAVTFEFDDGWLEARFHLTREEAERQAARVGRERACAASGCDLRASSVKAIEVKVTRRTRAP